MSLFIEINLVSGNKSEESDELEVQSAYHRMKFVINFVKFVFEWEICRSVRCFNCLLLI
jgi:hypothetical protein